MWGSSASQAKLIAHITTKPGFRECQANWQANHSYQLTSHLPYIRPFNSRNFCCMHQTRLSLVILALGLLQCLLLVLIALTPLPDNTGGLAHTLYNGMRIGGDGAARYTPIAALAYWFQVVVLAQICCMVALGVKPARRSTTFWVLLTVCFGAGAFVWTALISSYESFLATGETSMVAGFPVATSWLVYAIWFAGLALVALYVLGFKRYVWSDADQSAFDALVQQTRKSQ
jgi:hypothetical protein